MIKLPGLLFVFDVESIGVHGEGFAVAGGLYTAENEALHEFCFACPQIAAQGFADDRKWVAENIPAMPITHEDCVELRNAFWAEWLKAKDRALMFAECGWPVEARFLRDCVYDEPERWKTGPYPFHEISTVMLLAGMNPKQVYPRLENEQPAHHPLNDARQSARLLCESLRKLSTQ